MAWKRIYRESLGERLCEFTRDEVSELLDAIGSSENPRYDRSNIDKYLDFTSPDRVYCGLVNEHGNCSAIAVLSNGNPESGYCFLLEIQGLRRGSGAKMLHELADKYHKLWLIADPSAEDTLVDYYRREEFDFKEHVVEDSCYGVPLHVFYTRDCDSKLIDGTSDENWGNGG